MASLARHEKADGAAAWTGFDETGGTRLDAAMKKEKAAAARRQSSSSSEN